MGGRRYLSCAWLAAMQTMVLAAEPCPVAECLKRVSAALPTDPCEPPSACHETPCMAAHIDASHGWECLTATARCDRDLLQKHNNITLQRHAAGLPGVEHFHGPKALHSGVHTVDETKAAMQRCATMAADPWSALEPYAQGAKRIGSRNNFAWLLAAAGVRGAAVEIGVANGAFSSIMLQGWEGCTHYFQIDPWGLDPTSKARGKEVTMLELGRSQNTYCQVLTAFSHSRYNGKVRQLRMGSVDASQFFADESLAFVYVDGNHYYEWVKQDIESFWPKLEPGGILAGHDYFWPVDTAKNWTTWGGVRRAVQQEFAAREQLTFHLTNAMKYPGCCPSWYVIKPPPEKRTRAPDMGRYPYMTQTPSECTIEGERDVPHERRHQRGEDCRLVVRYRDAMWGSRVERGSLKSWCWYLQCC